MAGRSTLIAAGKDAATGKFKVYTNRTVMVVGHGFAADTDDEMTLEVSYDGGTNYVPMWNANAQVKITGPSHSSAKQTYQIISAPGDYLVRRAANQTQDIGAVLVRVPS